MSRNWFRRGQRLKLGTQECVIENRLPNGHLQLRNEENGACFARSYEALVDSLFDGQLAISQEAYVPRGLEKKDKLLDLMVADFTQMEEKVREEAKRRLKYVTEIRKRNISGRTPKTLRPLIEEVAQSTGDSTPPSWRTLCEWHHRFLSSGENVRSLVPFFSWRGNRKRRIQERVVGIIKEVIDEKFLTPQRITVASIVEFVALKIADENRIRSAKDEKLKVPDRATVYREVAKLDVYEKMAARYGKRIADLKWRAYKQGVRPTRPLERVEIDHTKLDLFVVDPEGLPIGRPWLTSAIDVYSKCILGYYMSFNPPSYLSVMQCLKHSIAPKSYLKAKYDSVTNRWDAHGLPETVVVDNAKEFHSTHFEDACLQLNILIQYAPIRLAWYKGSVERHFGTLNTRLLHQQPGTTFSNIFDKGDYDPKKNAVIDMATLDEILHVWIVDDYHQREHRGIKNIPALVWEQGIAKYPPALPSERDELAVLLGMIDERTVSSSGIELHSLFYNDEELALLRRGMGKGDKVAVKYDPTDLSFIHVWDSGRGTFILVPAVDQLYTQNLTLWQHEVIKGVARKREREKVKIEDLAKAKQTVEELVKRGWAKAKRNVTRQKFARYLKHGEIDRDAPQQRGRQAEGGPSVIQLESRRSKALAGHGNDSARGISNPVVGSNDAGEQEDKQTGEDPVLPAPEVTDARIGEIGGVMKTEAAMKKRGKTKTKTAERGTTPPVSTPTGNPPDAIPEDDEELDTTGWDADQDLPSKEAK